MTISSVGGFPTVNWCGGSPQIAPVYAGTIVNGFVVPDHSSADIGWSAGTTATIVTAGTYQGPITSTATAHLPIFCSVGGIYCMATANITGVPNWAGA